ncbi:MAG: M1 family metallopeptidase [Chitinophagales bacterium]|nr:M1 family metallopeptidase [Chitinophagales bacterium]
MIKFRFYILLSATIVLFSQCDPAKKVYSSEEYLGDIDTSYVEGYPDEDYYEGDYYDETYNYGGSDSAYSHYSPAVYQGSATRTNDIIHTKLDVRFDWAKAWMFGKVTLTVKPYYRATNELVLDAKGFEIKEVSLLDGGKKTPLHYIYNKDTIPDTFQIKIDLGKTFTRDEQYQIFIDYIAKPNSLPLGGSVAITGDKGLYFINNEGKEKDKPMQIWTQGETEASSCWFPTIDKPNEKTTQEIYITIEDKFNTLSNGLLISSTKNGDGTRTDYWKMDLPHAPYLFMMAIGEYAIVKDTWEGKEVSDYVEKKYEPYAKMIFGNTPEMMTFYSTKLGLKYPWQKYSQIVVRDYVSGAMENTTATVHGEFLQQDDRAYLDETWEDVISHELFHQWFGDYVTCESWSNIPLNESFATYGEYLWQEYKYGRESADYHHYNDVSSYLAEAGMKQEDLIRFNYITKDDMFDSHSYAKGGCVLHMLRKYVGDEAFFAALNKYLFDNKFQAVEIHHLRLAFEEITGEDMNWFFNQWFLSSGHPDLATYYTYDDISQTVTLSVSQLQDTMTTPVYVLPVDVDIYINGKAERHHITIDKRMQEFTFSVNAKPDLVNFDAEKMLLGTVSTNLNAEEYQYMYDHAPLFQDRFDAIKWIAYDHATNTTSYDYVIKAMDDKNWVIRQFAIDTIRLDTNTPSAIYDKLMYISINDPRSYVRSTAILRLGEMAGTDNIATLEKAMKDKSYTVQSSALSMLYIKDSVKAAQYARTLMHENNIDLLLSVWDIIAMAGDAKDNDYFLSMFDKYGGWQKYYVMVYYLTYLQNQEDFTIIQKGVDQFKEVAQDDSQESWYSMLIISYLQSLKDYYTSMSESQATSTQTQWTLANAYIDKVLEELNQVEGDY